MMVLTFREEIWAFLALLRHPEWEENEATQL
jgi:hypothetical protein